MSIRLNGNYLTLTAGHWSISILIPVIVRRHRLTEAEAEAEITAIRRRGLHMLNSRRLGVEEVVGEATQHPVRAA